MITTTIPPATAAWLIQIDRPEPLAARRRRQQLANALKALGVVLLLAAIAF